MTDIAMTDVTVPPNRRGYRITHRTTYRYSDDVTSSYGRGFLTPRDSGRQRCLFYELVVDPVPSDSSTGLDVYGNVTSYFHVTQPHRQLTITGHAVVQVDPPAPEDYSSGAALEAWKMARTSITASMSSPARVCRRTGDAGSVSSQSASLWIAEPGFELSALPAKA